MLAEASEFGEGARFVGVGAEAFLVEGGDMPWRVAYLGTDPDERGGIWTFPAGSWRGLDALSVTSDRFSGVFALACGASHKEPCLLLSSMNNASDAGAQELTELAGARLPEGIEGRGLAYDPARDAVCVFGNALVCFDTRWTTMIGPECGVKIIDVAWAPGTATMIAIAEHGRWWMRTQNASGKLQHWVEQPPIQAEDDPVGASVSNREVALFGRRTWWHVLPSGGVHTCTQDQDVGAVIVYGSSTDLVLRDGQVRHGYSDWCAERVDLGTDPVIDWSKGSCRESVNPRVLTSTRIVGTSACLMFFD
ncbi:MAG TPA: hypothetical protein VG963_30700 [Polyangiaceae bacterium]|nr:hypothetical protein [Polyangiaceae bacterium]